MRKSTIFISSVLTTFALVMLYGVVSAYRNISSIPKVSALAADTATAAATLEPVQEVTATATILTPEQAAQLAVQVVGNSNLLSAESSNLNGVNAYKITFTNNDIVYVSLDGQILGVQVAPMVVNVAVPIAPEPAKRRNRNNNDAPANPSGENQPKEPEKDD